MEKEFYELPCKQLKEELITIIENMDCDDRQLFEIRYLMELDVNDPIPDEEFSRGKVLFNDNYSGKFRQDFIINKREINRMIGENWDKRYFHIFFIDDNGDLGIVFRFSNIETFDLNNYEIDLNNETAYLLRGQIVETFNRTYPSFTSLRQNYKNGIGTKIMSITNRNPCLTEYITYSMKKIFLFGGFKS